MESVECLYDKYIKDFRCKYYMTKTTKKYIDDEDTVKVFGVKIDKLDLTGSILQSACVEDVGINEQDVRQYIKLLKDGRVTPVTLEDIISDRN